MELTRSQTSEEDLCVRTESLSVCEVTVFQTSIYPFIYLCMKDFFFFFKEGALRRRDVGKEVCV